MSRISFASQAKRFRWEQVDNPEGPATLTRAESPQGALQVSTILHQRGQRPGAGPADLIDLAVDAAKGQAFDVISTRSGACPFGCYGVVKCRSTQFACIQVWYLSNGDDFILATYIAESEDDTEVREAESIIFNLSLARPRRWWKFLSRA